MKSTDNFMFLQFDNHILIGIPIIAVFMMVTLLDYLMAMNNIVVEKMMMIVNIIKNFLGFFEESQIAKQLIKVIGRQLLGIRLALWVEMKNYGQVEEVLNMDEIISFRQMVNVEKKRMNVTVAIAVAITAINILGDVHLAMLNMHQNAKEYFQNMN